MNLSENSRTPLFQSVIAFYVCIYFAKTSGLQEALQPYGRSFTF